MLHVKTMELENRCLNDYFQMAWTSDKVSWLKIKWFESSRAETVRQLTYSQIYINKQLFIILFLKLLSVVLVPRIFNNYSSSPNGLWVNSPWGLGPNGYWLRGHVFSKIQQVGQEKYRDKTSSASSS